MTATSALAQIPAVPTVTAPDLPPVPELPAPAPQLPSAPAPELPAVPDLPAAPVPVPELPDPPSLPVAGDGGAPIGEGGTAPSGGAAGSGGSAGGDAGRTAAGGGSGATGATASTVGRPGGAPRSRGAGATPDRSGAPLPRVRRERRLRRAVARLRGCLDAVRPGQRRVLVLRAGLGPADPLSRAEVAERLDKRIPAIRRIERRGLRSLRSSARDGCGDATTSSLRAVSYDLGADREPSGGGASGTATARADEPGRSEVKDEFRSGPGGAPGATLTPPPLGGGDGGPPVLPLLALGFLVGFAVVWTLERRRAATVA